MRKIEYYIRKDKNNNPYIELPNSNMDVEDIFFCFEMTRYRINAILNDDKNKILPKEALQELVITNAVVAELSLKISEMIDGSNSALDDANDILSSDND